MKINQHMVMTYVLYVPLRGSDKKTLATAARVFSLGKIYGRFTPGLKNRPQSAWPGIN